MATQTGIDQVKLLKDISRLTATMERKLGRLAKEPGGRALRSVAEIWMTEAKKRTPVDTGVLRSSGFVQGPKFVGGGTWEVRLVFGGAAASYAAAVHENLTARHAVGQAKYLESVIVERKPRLAQEVATMLFGGARAFGATFGGG